MRLRVALVHSFYSSEQPSGENAQVEAEVEALRRSGVDVRLFAARTDDLESDRLYRLRSAVRVATGRGASPLDEVEAFAPDVVHAHNLFPNVGRTWVRRLSAPLVVTLHNFRFACANAVLFRDGHVCTDCPDGDRWSGLRHRCYRGSATATLPLTLAQRGGPAADPVLARADRILCLSARQREMLAAGGIRGRSWSTGRTSCRPTSIPRAIGRRRATDGAICVGRLSSEKGVLELVNGWESAARLTVVGDGPLFEEVKRAAAGRNVDVLGRVERSAALDLMAHSGALVMSGLCPEVAPLSYIEALASGLPVVVRSSSDVSTRVVEDGTGQVIASMDDAADASARVQADPALNAHCRRVYESRYTEDSWRLHMLDLYDGVARAVTGSPSGAPGPSS